jgi:hypothetical protein
MMRLGRRLTILPARRKCLGSNGPAPLQLGVARGRTDAKFAADLNYPGDFNLMRYSSRFALLAAATILTPPAFAAPAAGALAAKSVPIPTLVRQVSATG